VEVLHEERVLGHVLHLALAMVCLVSTRQMSLPIPVIPFMEIDLVLTAEPQRLQTEN
jgi:hypothetical protein